MTTSDIAGPRRRDASNGDSRGPRPVHDVPFKTGKASPRYSGRGAAPRRRPALSQRCSPVTTGPKNAGRSVRSSASSRVSPAAALRGRAAAVTFAPAVARCGAAHQMSRVSSMRPGPSNGGA